MQVQKARYVPMMDGWLTDWGHGVMQGVRGAGHVVAEEGRTVTGMVTGFISGVRGDTPTQTVEGAAPINYANLAVYGTLAAIALLIVVKPKRR